MSTKKEETLKEKNVTIEENEAGASDGDASKPTTTIIPVVETTNAEGTTYYHIDAVGGTPTMFLQQNELGSYQVLTLGQSTDAGTTAIDNNQRVFTIPIGTTIIQASVNNPIVPSITSSSNVTTTIAENNASINRNVTPKTVKSATSENIQGSSVNTHLLRDYSNFQNPQKVFFEGKEYPLHISKANYKPDPTFAPFSEACRQRVKELIIKGEVRVIRFYI